MAVQNLRKERNLDKTKTVQHVSDTAGNKVRLCNFAAAATVATGFLLFIWKSKLVLLLSKAT